MIDINLLKTDFRKLLTYTYFDKSDMVLLRNVALFTKSLTKEKNREIIKKYCSRFVSFNMFFHTP